jgi:hypothetical protein
MHTAQERKERPLYSGVLKYFPDALLEVAHTSYKGNEQHHPGQPLHWDRSKSTDEADACARHLMQAGTLDTDGVRHSAKAAWRALALLQKEIEAAREVTPKTEIGTRVRRVWDDQTGVITKVSHPNWFDVRWDDGKTNSGWTWTGKPDHGSLERL